MKENKKWEKMTLKEKATGCITFIVLAFIFIAALGWLIEKCSAPSEEDMLPHTKIELKSNGTVVPVANYLKNNLNDPNSYQPIEWSRIIETDKGVYSVRHRYRAKNAFNALIVCDQVFSMDSLGNIINVQDYKR